ncbi:hypothetical protein ACFFQF_14230 [Haladaptatus pallidirubidus]|uniref:Small CPxCG-related zinc finger protein n=1 Tax=Haladaptatus pallidirubidus TaxID=1008152 RepID=A0AAV3UD19_9EURY|nr:hypothetical protein [Haladaptatus pallidirubidus]
MPTCPDCDVAMEAVEHQTFGDERIQIKPSGGVLNSLGLSVEYLNSYRCPECRLVRFYDD